MKKITRILLSLTLAALLCAGTGLTAFAAEAAPSVTIPVEIVLSGTLPDTAEDFTVKLEAKDATNPMPEGSKDGVYIMTVTGAGTKNFPSITYPGVGIYEYSIYQVKGSHADVTYDDTVYQLTVYVTNAEDGSGLEISAVLYPDEVSTKDSSAAFTNIYPTVTPTPEPTPDPAPDPSPAPSATSGSPKTGDNSNTNLYAAFAGVSAAVIVLLVAARKRAGKTEEQE